MLDQNLLDKQYILESLVDLLEKNTINNTSPLSNVTNQPLQRLSINASTQQHQSLVNEFPTVKLILNTSMHKFFSPKDF